MRIPRLLLVPTLCLATRPLFGATAVQSLDQIQYWAGSGENRAAMIIDWSDGKALPGETLGEALIWGYRWPVGETRTGQQMLQAIADADPRLFLRVDTRSYGQIVFGIGYDLDGDGGGFTFDPATENGGASDLDDHFAEGWEVDGYWGYKLGGPSTMLPPFSESGTGFSSRSLSNNSWDAWVFTSFDLPGIPNPDQPLAAAIPEPTTASLLACGALLCFKRRRTA
jgi:hypothetical protein